MTKKDRKYAIMLDYGDEYNVAKVHDQNSGYDAIEK
jgi:hypothetical protein